MSICMVSSNGVKIGVKVLWFLEKFYMGICIVTSNGVKILNS